MKSTKSDRNNVFGERENVVKSLHPSPGYQNSGSIYKDVKFPNENPRDGNLPYVVINMVASVDGFTSVEGKSGGIGREVDRSVMRILRSRVDAVASGAGTVKLEKVSMTSEGMRNPEPKAVIFTSSMNFPPENLTSLHEQETIIVTSERTLRNLTKDPEARGNETKRTARIISAKTDEENRLDLREALAKLKEEFQIQNLLLEGGPSINSQMISLGLVSEIFLTISPKLLGLTSGGSPGILSRATGGSSKDLELISVYLSPNEDELFLRYKLA